MDVFNKIEVEVRDPDKSLIRFIDYVRKIANAGHSFEVVVDPDSRENGKSFGFDGDGPFFIKSVKLNGKEIKSKDDLTENYLRQLQEQEIGKAGIPKKKPSPSFAYELVYKKPAPPNRRGRPPFPVEHRVWKGLVVDKHLKDKWLSDLNNIPNVEIRGTCEGHNKDWVSYVAFRLDPKYDDNKAFLKSVAKKLSQYPNTVCGYDIGTQGRPRFVVATPLFYGCDKQKEWENWWNNIARRINKAVNR